MKRERLFLGGSRKTSGDGQGFNEGKKQVAELQVKEVGSIGGQNGADGSCLRGELWRQTAQVCLENNDQSLLTKAGTSKQENNRRNLQEWGWAQREVRELFYRAQVATQGPRTKPGPPPCFILPGTLFPPGGSTELLLNC